MFPSREAGVHVCAKDLRFPICMWGGPASLSMYMGKTCMLPSREAGVYVCGEDLRLCICMWGDPASLCINVERTCVSLYVCGEDLRLFMRMWGGPASLSVYVGRMCIVPLEYMYVWETCIRLSRGTPLKVVQCCYMCSHSAHAVKNRRITQRERRGL